MPEQTLTFTLTYTNYGPGLASNVVITDIVPITLTNVHYSFYGAQIAPTGSSRYVWHIGSLGAGDGGAIILVGTVDRTLTSETTFTNTVTIVSETPDNNPINNDDSAAVSVKLPASIGDYVWGDLNANGIQEAGERGLSDLAVKLYDNQGRFVTTTATSASGLYSFADLMPGDYCLEFAPPSSYRFSPQDQGDDTLDSDADATTGKTVCAILQSGQHDLTWDAGLYTRMYLPLVMRQFVVAPDLVVSNIIPAINNITVTIMNQGNAPVIDTFYVDLYINPASSTLPITVNQVCCKPGYAGLFWGVTDTSMLTAGGMLTLTLSDSPYYGFVPINFSGSFTNGMRIYVQVDSANTGIYYGKVLENHEITGGEYNNVNYVIVTDLRQAYPSILLRHVRPHFTRPSFHLTYTPPTQTPAR